MVKFYGRSVIRQCIKSRYLPGYTAEKFGGRDLVLQLSDPYFRKCIIIYCDRFFLHLVLLRVPLAPIPRLANTSCPHSGLQLSNGEKLSKVLEI